MSGSVDTGETSTVNIDDVKLGQCYTIGHWQPIVSADGTQPLYNPATGEVLAQAPLAGAEDVNNALVAAKEADIEWRRSNPVARAAILGRIADGFSARREYLIALSTLNNGKVRAEATIDVDDAIATYRYYAAAARNLNPLEALDAIDEAHKLYRRHEGVGVCSLIVPWNFPMVTTAWKVAPALAAGCCVVLKPSEVTLLPELVLGDIASAAGVPAGVLNIVPGAAAAGQAMVANKRVRKVSFTGSNAVGEKVMQNAATNMQKISLELGGKSPIVVFGDVDIDWAVDQIMAGIFFNAGQMCSATSRLIVAESIADELYANLRQATEALRVGPASAADSDMGPLVSRVQFDRVGEYMAVAEQEGLNCLTGGHPLERAGFFVAPTIYTDVPATSRLWQEEIFGPVLVSSRFRSEEQAIQQANDTRFGLAATVLSKDTQRGWRMMAAIDAGTQWLNDYQVAPPMAGWGGHKHSGIGRELGMEGLQAYQETKYLIVPNGAEP